MSEVYTDSYKQRDKYGRTVTHFTVNGRTVAVLVTMPKPYVERTGNKYLVNDWASATQGDVAEFVKRSEGVKHAEQIVAREVAKAHKEV